MILSNTQDKILWTVDGSVSMSPGQQIVHKAAIDYLGGVIPTKAKYFSVHGSMV